MSIAAFKKLAIGCLALSSVVISSQAQASISLSGTRLILPEKQQEASIIVRNDNSPILVQSWLETNAEQDQAELPFAITPALVKVPPNGQQVMRVLYAGGDQGLPRDKETVLWLNVQEIPQQGSGDNQLQIAIRQRIKLFFRPDGLPGSADQAPGQLQWSVVHREGIPMLEVHNPSAYHVSMSTLRAANGKEMEDPGMIAPGQTRLLSLGGTSTQATLEFRAISDYGSADPYEVHLNGQAKVQGRALSPDK
ncbi:molecular chaperone [Alcaligenes faecalis subsp. phenolicus]|uniref:fimbrial biogenesis chaperone n=1 Tax=Alcaligenes nematophilus TaxID=2994643 RepID=UPI002AA40376|nr:molecular chaperone [Alcaligenes phenolicus]